MGANVVHFYAGETARIYDDSSPYGEVCTISRVSGTAVFVESALGANYSQSRNAEMQPQSHFTPMTYPNIRQVTTLIEENEDTMDEELHTSFRANGTRVSEFITPGLRGRYNYPSLNEPLRYGFDTDNPIFFEHSPVLPLDPSKGDELRIMTASNDWTNVIAKDSGYLMWDDDEDVVVNSTTLTGNNTITTSAYRITSFLHFQITLNGVAGTMTLIGVDKDGVNRTETFAISNTTEDWTSYAYRTITSLTTNGSISLYMDTRPETSRLNDQYDLWADNEHGIYCMKKTLTYSHRSVRAKYRKSYHRLLGGIPGFVKKMCKYLCAIDIYENEKYALNLPGGEGEDAAIKQSMRLQRWKRRYEELLSKKREFVGGQHYE